MLAVDTIPMLARPSYSRSMQFLPACSKGWLAYGSGLNMAGGAFIWMWQWLHVHCLKVLSQLQNQAEKYCALRACVMALIGHENRSNLCNKLVQTRFPYPANSKGQVQCTSSGDTACPGAVVREGAAKGCTKACPAPAPNLPSNVTAATPPVVMRTVLGQLSQVRVSPESGQNCMSTM